MTALERGRQIMESLAHWRYPGTVDYGAEQIRLAVVEGADSNSQRLAAMLRALSAEDALAMADYFKNISTTRASNMRDQLRAYAKAAHAKS